MEGAALAREIFGVGFKAGQTSPKAGSKPFTLS
jgi:hypothetical protein